MAQINYDCAAKSTSATGGISGGSVVTRSSDTTYTLAGIAGVSILSTATKADVIDALHACLRAVKRDFQECTSAAGLPTSGDTTE